MVALKPGIARENVPSTNWRGGPPWFPSRIQGYRITLWADGFRYRARIADATPAGLNILVDDAGGQLMERLFLCQLVHIVSGHRRIAGSVRYTFEQSGWCCVAISLHPQLDQSVTTLSADDEIIFFMR